jgi:hypothetical protein
MSKRPRTEKVLEISPTPEILTLQPEDLFKSRVELTCPPKDLGTITVRIPCQPTDGYFDTFAKVQGFLDGIEIPKVIGFLNWVFSPPFAERAPEQAYHEYTLVGGVKKSTINDGDATDSYSVYTESNQWKHGAFSPYTFVRTIVFACEPTSAILSDVIKMCKQNKKLVHVIFCKGPPHELPTTVEFPYLQQDIRADLDKPLQYYLTADGKNRIIPQFRGETTTSFDFHSTSDSKCKVKELIGCIAATEHSKTYALTIFFHGYGQERKAIADFWKTVPPENKNNYSKMSFVGLALKCALFTSALTQQDMQVVVQHDAASFSNLNFTSGEAACFAKELLDLPALERKKGFQKYTEHQATFLEIPLNDLLQKYQDGGYYNARFGIHSENIDDMYGYPSNKALPIRNVYDGIKAAFVDRCLL